MALSSPRPGYIFLISVLILGTVAVAATVSLLLLGWAAEQNSQVQMNSHQALDLASTCAERTLQTLRTNINYAGSQTFTYSYGSCNILAISPTGTQAPKFCTVGYSGNVQRMEQWDVSRLTPTVLIQKSGEVTCCGALDHAC